MPILGDQRIGIPYSTVYINGQSPYSPDPIQIMSVRSPGSVYRATPGQPTIQLPPDSDMDEQSAENSYERAMQEHPQRPVSQTNPGPVTRQTAAFNAQYAQDVGWFGALGKVAQTATDSLLPPGAIGGNLPTPAKLGLMGAAFMALRQLFSPRPGAVPNPTQPVGEIADLLKGLAQEIKS